MKTISGLGTLMILGAVLLLVMRPASIQAGTEAAVTDFKVLAPISHGNLTIFPVVAAKVHDTSGFITLDEGIHSGDVTGTEVGKVHSIRRRPPQAYVPSGGAEVNGLVLINNSKRPLILLAGEVVTGGKQDRVVGKDRIVPAESDPVDLSVFCVEHGRWVESSAKFDTHAYVMAQPSVRKQAMVANNQQKVWDEVANSKASMSANSRANLSKGTSSTVDVENSAQMIELQTVETTTSYAKTRENKDIEQQAHDI